jgi:thiamine-monophosphate kinase
MRQSSEDDFLRRVRRKAFSKKQPGLVLGIGDDCAIFRPRAGEDLVFTTDMMLEDVHFRRESHPPGAVGYKALARGLSDIAAMGATPRFCLLSLAFGQWTDQRWADAFYRGFLRLARETGTVLAGGDLARAERMSCDVVVTGAVPKGKALRRDGARAGDAIYVSGRLGGAALGLETRCGSAWKRHLRPEPRLSLGRFLREKLQATAAMDISDGLALDLHRLCLESRISASIDRELPVFPGAQLDHVLHGGEDYELLFTVKPETRVPPAFEGIPLTRIGIIKPGRPGRVYLFNRPLPPVGYDHLRRTEPARGPAADQGVRPTG